MQSYNYLFRQVDFDFVIVIVILWNIKFGYLTIKKKKKNTFEIRGWKARICKILRSLEQCIQTVKGQNKLKKHSNNSNSNWKKLLGFRNMQEKLEKWKSNYCPIAPGWINAQRRNSLKDHSHITSSHFWAFSDPPTNYVSINTLWPIQYWMSAKTAIFWYHPPSSLLT